MTSPAIALDAAAPPRFQPFRREALELALLIGFLPNALFLLAMPFYIAERMLSPLLYLVAGLLSLRLPRWAACLCFLIAAAIDLGLIVSAAFHLPFDTALGSLKYMASIDVTASAFYLSMATAVVGTALLAAWRLSGRRERLRRASPTPAALLAGLFMLLDWQFNFPYIQSKLDDLPFQSAVQESGLADAAAVNGNNILIVMVEGMGAFADPAERAVLSDRLEQVARSSGYGFEHGVSSYFGSTTGAESRELCGRWGDHLDYLGGRSYDCLPRRLAGRGYEAIAYHGFSSDMFDRHTWYPAIGFNRMHFKEDIIAAGPARVPSRCGSVFEGLCDTELAGLVRQELLTPSGKPKLVYWLTLNSHVPYVPQQAGQLGCTTPRAAIANRTVCQLSEYWADVIDQVARIAADPALPPTDILVVGDHHTPLWERAAKKSFTLNKVDWYALRHEG